MVISPLGAATSIDHGGGQPKDSGLMMVIDCDQHLYEPRHMWRDHIEPAYRYAALDIVDDELGYAWLTWRGRHLQLADVQLPRATERLGGHRIRQRAGQPAEYSYDEALPDDYWDPAARVRRLDEMGLREAVLFPNFGLLWERLLSDDVPALLANMAAWNRWCASVAAAGRGRLHPAAHLSLRDAAWVDDQLRVLSAAGVRLAMIAAAPIDGRPMSDPEHDRIWSSFVEHGVTPAFHVADPPRAFADGWYADARQDFVSPFDSILLSMPPALALTDLIINGALARHPDLRIGVVELGATWVPHYLMMLDGGWEFTKRINGRPPVELAERPSDYFRQQVRVAAFSYEDPARLAAQAGDLFMACSDYPHAEGTDQPLADYATIHLTPDTAPALFRDNVAVLLGAGAGEAVSAPVEPVDMGWLAAQQS
jgi:predicted TIM-barrel fold metal-dependent hydrolase